MKSIVIPKPGEISVLERPMPAEPDKDEVIVRVKAAGICGSDLHISWKIRFCYISQSYRS